MQIFMLATTFSRTQASALSCVPNAAAAVMRRRRVDVAHTRATTSASAQPVTMVADYVTSATVRTPFVAMAILVATYIQSKHAVTWR